MSIVIMQYIISAWHASIYASPKMDCWVDTSLLCDYFPGGFVENQVVEEVNNLQHYLIIFLLSWRTEEGKISVKY